MRCKSIKREFVCRSQSLWGWEPLPCHSGAANFLLLHTQTWGLPTVLIALRRDPLLEFQMTASCRGSRWFIKIQNSETKRRRLYAVDFFFVAMNTVQCTQTVIQFICEAQSKYHRMQIMLEKQTVTFFFFFFFFARMFWNLFCQDVNTAVLINSWSAAFIEPTENERGWRSRPGRREKEEQGHRRCFSECELEFVA